MPAIATAITATDTLSCPNAGDFEYHQISGAATGGAWTLKAQWSEDGTTWFDASDALSLGSGESGTIFLQGRFPYLQAVAERTGGSFTGSYLGYGWPRTGG